MSEGKRKPRIGRLDSVGGVITEMSRVYRLAARDELDDKKAARLVGMLAEIRRALELGEFEDRLKALEARRRKRSSDGLRSWKRRPASTSRNKRSKYG